MVVPKAIWNPARDVWETESIDLFSEHSDVYSETWPTSGMTRNGVVYALPTPELPTADTGSSSLPTPRASDTGTEGRRASEGFSPPLSQVIFENLLPTPAAMNPNDGEYVETWEARRQRVKAKGINGNGLGTPLAIAVQLLPTPTTQDASNTGGPSQFDRNSLPLNTVVTLLPTPAANDSGNTPEQHLRKKPGREVVTSLMVLVDHGLIPTGGRMPPPSNAGNASPDA